MSRRGRKRSLLPLRDISSGDGADQDSPVYSFDRLVLSVFFLNSELRDKEEWQSGMLTGANQAGHRCGKYQSVCSWTRFCTVSLGRQSRQAPMCEIDDLSHAQEARVEREGALPEELIIIFLISHH